MIFHYVKVPIQVVEITIEHMQLNMVVDNLITAAIFSVDFM